MREALPRCPSKVSVFGVLGDVFGVDPEAVGDQGVVVQLFALDQFDGRFNWRPWRCCR